VNHSAFIYITGADGTGKSTHAHLLCQHLQRRGIRCRHLWLRFPFFCSLPLLAYARLRGYSWHEVTDGIDHGYWDFRRSWLMRRVFPVALLIDATVASFFKVHLPLGMGRTIVCERYVLDMLVDLQSGMRRSLLDSWEYGGFLRLLPRGALVVGLVAPEPVVIQRRPDLQHDRLFGAKLSAYAALFQRIDCPVVETVQPEEEVRERIEELARTHFGP
jgi:hypothetical protein